MPPGRKLGRGGNAKKGINIPTKKKKTLGKGCGIAVSEGGKKKHGPRRRGPQA